jgi:hypothetical protein
MGISVSMRFCMICGEHVVSPARSEIAQLEGEGYPRRR